MTGRTKYSTHWEGHRSCRAIFAQQLRRGQVRPHAGWKQRHFYQDGDIIKGQIYVGWTIAKNRREESNGIEIRQKLAHTLCLVHCGAETTRFWKHVHQQELETSGHQTGRSKMYRPNIIRTEKLWITAVRQWILPAMMTFSTLAPILIRIPTVTV